MAEPITPRLSRPAMASVFVLTIAATIATLRWEGQGWWCACGELSLWKGNIWSEHCSQHLLDPYSFSHLLHGVLFFFATLLLLPRAAMPWRLWAAVAVECAWEVLENSPIVIHRYREATISLGYAGDSIFNSVADIGCCTAGFLLALRLGVRRSALVFVLTELVLLATIRDNLTLNVIMLVCPIEAIKTWQMAH